MHSYPKHNNRAVPHCGNGHRLVAAPHGNGIRQMCIRCLVAALAHGGAFRASILGTLCHYLNAHERDAHPRRESAAWQRATEAIIGWMNRRDEYYLGNLALGCAPGITDRAGWIPADYTPHHGGEITPELIRRAARHVAGATGLHYNQTAMLPLEVFADYLDLVVSGFKE